jgi:60 kDa SS-A/Ro ribonucleoprotein
MANKTLFANKNVTQVPVADTRNLAGGRAYSLSDEAALCQYVVTSTLNGTYYASADAHLQTVQGLVKNVRSELLAKAAVYGYEQGKMKDLPAYLLAELAARGEIALLRQAFPRVIVNVKMLCNFVQIVRSGVTGRKSFGTAVRNIIREWLRTRNPDQLFRQQFGHSAPSVADILKMVHPRPSSPTEAALYGYLIGKEVDESLLPVTAQEFEVFKRDNTAKLPSLDYRSLINCNLNENHWKQIARNMPWNMLRMNLNKLAREKVFNDKDVVKQVVSKLSDKTEVLKNNAFPYQLMTTFQNISDDVPMSIKLALQDALDAATDNVPSFGNEVAVLVDVSGSMSSPVTGTRGDVSTKTRCVDVAALIASCVLRKNPDSWIVQYDTTARRLHLNPRDSVMSNAQRIAANGGGTDTGCALNFIRKGGCKAKTVIIVSDNMSWINQNGYNGSGGWGRNYGTNAQVEWQKYHDVDVKGSKLICVDLQPNTTVQVKDDKNVLNVGGFSDSVFTVAKSFVDGGRDHFLQVVEKVSL